METGSIHGIDKPISRLVQGTVMLHTDRLDEGFALLDGIYAAGCTTFDTAHGYGGGVCERVLGRWIEARGLREDVVILGKGAHHNMDRRRVTPFDITADLHDSLARLRTDYIDLYVLHRDDPAMPVEPIVDVLNHHMQAGHIRAFGGSNWSVERIEAANHYAHANHLQPFVVSSPNFSLAVQRDEPWENCRSISGPDAELERAWYQEREMPLFVWSSLAGGFLTGRYRRDNLDQLTTRTDEMIIRCYASEENFGRLERAEELGQEKGLTLPQMALAYVLSQPLDIYALVGCRTPEEFAENVKASEVRLSDEEIRLLEAGR